MEQKEKTIAEILKNAPKGTKLYSPIFGECTLERVDDDVIRVTISDGTVYMFSETGCFFRNCEGAECLLFPSKDNRSWADFEYRHQFKPFDKVVARDCPSEKWQADFFSHYEDGDYHFTCIGGGCWRYCLPYNEMTAKLIGTTDELNG